jgi:hypothetical protein
VVVKLRAQRVLVTPVGHSRAPVPTWGGVEVQGAPAKLGLAHIIYVRLAHFTLSLLMTWAASILAASKLVPCRITAANVPPLHPAASSCNKHAHANRLPVRHASCVRCPQSCTGGMKVSLSVMEVSANGGRWCCRPSAAAAVGAH